MFWDIIRSFTRIIISALFHLQTSILMKGIWYLPGLANFWHFTTVTFNTTMKTVMYAIIPLESFIKVGLFSLNWNITMRRTNTIYGEKDIVSSSNDNRTANKTSSRCSGFQHQKWKIVSTLKVSSQKASKHTELQFIGILQSNFQIHNQWKHTEKKKKKPIKAFYAHIYVRNSSFTMSHIDQMDRKRHDQSLHTASIISINTILFSLLCLQISKELTMNGSILSRTISQ